MRIPLNDLPLSAAVGALLFAADQPMSLAAMLEIFQREPETSALTTEQLQEAVEALRIALAAEAFPFEVQALAGGYQLLTKRPYFAYARHVSQINNQKKLSRSAMETLSIIAYRQPVTKGEIEFIRGVGSDYAIQKLLERNLITISGRADAPGKPLLYATSPYFMQYFGLNSPADLPRLKEFELSEEEQLEIFRQQQPSAGTAPIEN